MMMIIIILTTIVPCTPTVKIHLYQCKRTEKDGNTTASRCVFRLAGLLRRPKAGGGTLAARVHPGPAGTWDGEGGYDGNDDGGGGGSLHFSSILLLRLESSFVSSDKFGVGNPSVRAG